ncbi:MAG: MraY family glycosyltransferase [Trinickia sp.]|uniref:MraY family glycosyltransferase n=1 Tax=Trinickia sp. TaxID=2571163 RepID=UPI003F7E5CB5
MVIEHIGLSSVPLSLAIATAAALVCSAILAILLKTGLAWRLATDIPNARSLHERPTPRVGGWGVVPTVLIAAWACAPDLWLIAACVLFLAAVSQLDDRRGLPVRIRFAAHFLAVAVLIAVYPVAAPWWCLAVLSVLLVWLVNLYNFMDGSDGLAGGMALFGFGAYAIAALLAEQPARELALVSAATAGAAIGFLAFNFHPARIFLGDAGSIPLGFLAGALGYWGWRSHAWPIWFPTMCFAPFIGDASVTLLRRLIRGEKFWEAHREHYYQRMIRAGLGHTRTAIYWYLLMLFGTMIALAALGLPIVQQWMVVVLWAGALLGAGAIVDARWRRFYSTVQAKGDVNVPK